MIDEECVLCDAPANGYVAGYPTLDAPNEPDRDPRLLPLCSEHYLEVQSAYREQS
jgi:hypothetical protein